MYNHIINFAEALSFRHIKEEVCEELVNLFKNGHLLLLHYIYMKIYYISAL